jgi:heme-degrading monooxygenase HmoA
MIARLWRGRATREGAEAYRRYALGTVFPQLRRIAGHEAAFLLNRPVGDTVEILVVTHWRSMDAIRRFAGLDPERAVVEPEARAALVSFDDIVSHYEVAEQDA